ncbi:MAG TPA: glutamine amidotransferase [Corynebacteriales bacterium]|nr:glutamine amidotransferase [Mycobacteriales bacterium]
MAKRESVVRIGALLPDIMSTYGDDGNALVLRKRLEWRGYQAEIVPITLQDAVPESCDIYTLGGGEDVAQILGAEHLRQSRGIFRAVEAGRPLLAVCAGLQMLGEWFQVADGSRAEGVGLLDITTQPQSERSIGELTATPLHPQLQQKLTGFENHMGATVLGGDAQPLGRVHIGVGNSVPAGVEPPAEGFVDGVVQGSIIATYMHGPVLARNPELADYLLAQALRVEPGSLGVLDLPVVDKLREERFYGALHPPRLDP